MQAERRPPAPPIPSRILGSTWRGSGGIAGGEERQGFILPPPPLYSLPPTGAGAARQPVVCVCACVCVCAEASARHGARGHAYEASGPNSRPLEWPLYIAEASARVCSGWACWHARALIRFGFARRESGALRHAPARARPELAPAAGRQRAACGPPSCHPSPRTRSVRGPRRAAGGHWQSGFWRSVFFLCH